MRHYIRFCADRLLQALNQPKIYNDTSPFPWVEMISLQGKASFFEKRAGERAKSGAGAESDHVFSLAEDF